MSTLSVWVQSRVRRLRGGEVGRCRGTPVQPRRVEEEEAETLLRKRPRLTPSSSPAHAPTPTGFSGKAGTRAAGRSRGREAGLVS